ncbi:MAG TPA: hypothetical protein PLZ50_10925 [Rubrivivax sp.]|nr:hypothetical protein [Rubrivivax sp.]
MPEATAAAMQDGRFRTADVDCIQGSNLFVTDRLQGVIKRAAKTVASAAVESCPLQHEPLAEAAVMAPHEGSALDPEVPRRFVAAQPTSHEARTRIVVAMGCRAARPASC